MKHFSLIRTTLLICLAAVAIFSSSCFYGPRVVASPFPPPQPVYSEPGYVMPPPPVWAPEYDNRDRVRYYYLPDMQCYYDVYRQQYVYSDGYNWIHSTYAPPAYSGYDMNSGYIVVLNYGVNDPWMNHNTYVNSYPQGYYNNSSYSQGQNNNGSYSGPRRGYNENDKSTLYHPGNSNSNGNPRPTNGNGGGQGTSPVYHPANPNGGSNPVYHPANPNGGANPVYQPANPNGSANPVYHPANPNGGGNPEYKPMNPNGNPNPEYKPMNPNGAPRVAPNENTNTRENNYNNNAPVRNTPPPVRENSQPSGKTIRHPGRMHRKEKSETTIPNHATIRTRGVRIHPSRNLL
jgi:hypothetical protein